MGILWKPVGKNLSWGNTHKLISLGKERKKRSFLSKILCQCIASLFVFFMVWGIFQFEPPTMVKTQDNIRNWFTSDYDIEPVINFFTSVGIWGDTLERAAFKAVEMPTISEPLIIPVSGQIGIPYGWIVKPDQSRVFHEGITIIAREGTPVRATLAGIVSRIANEEKLGRVIDISSEEEIVTRYAYCKEILVNLNDEISTGQVIAKVGKTGESEFNQLFFSILIKGQSTDPTKYFMPKENKI
ncbi:MAG: M23 family metallopeptidase [Clostridia bacterium]|nr:M23 family metallopeptidase [Clostridia bacterium]